MSEQIVVYAFVDSNGVDQDFVNLDRQAAAEYAEMNDFEIIERLYEYNSSRSIDKSDFDYLLDDWP